MTSAATVEAPPAQVDQIKDHWRPLGEMPATPHWTGRLAGGDYTRSLKSLRAVPDAPVSIYLHVPFCPVRCLYCGCNTTITHSSERIDHYLDCLEREIRLVTALVGRGRDLLQFHVGGGTPNYLNDSQLVRTVEMVAEQFRILGETETSIECNPRRASASQLALLRELGFRRISFGVQDLHPPVQKAIGRVHSKELVGDVCKMAREAGFEYINIDLIYGLPYQTTTSFQETVGAIVESAPDRVSCLAYSHNPVKRPHQHALDCAQLPSSLDRSALFRNAVTRFTESGYSWVGLDSFVLDTDELAIAQDEGRLFRNCIGYTSAPTSHLLAFGTGAIGDIDGTLIQNTESLSEWLNALATDQLPVASGHKLSKRQRRRRAALMQLLCNQRLPIDVAIQALPEEFARLDHYIAEGLVVVDHKTIRLTERGRCFLHDLCIDPKAALQADGSLWPLLLSTGR